MFASVLTAYTLFISRENLLDVNPLVYFLPVVSMVVTLVFIRKNVSFDEVPGFDRLSGLMVMVGCSFAVALAIQKTNIWIFFGGSIERLFILAAGVFALLKWGLAGCSGGATSRRWNGRNSPAAHEPNFACPLNRQSIKFLRRWHGRTSTQLSRRIFAQPAARGAGLLTSGSAS